jgi:Na+-transporting methylmalonyl-CoA/oxaloacetate decarboxylase gamma subunit
MDGSPGGAAMALIGVSTVFVALLTIVGVVSLVGRLVNRANKVDASAAGDTSGSAALRAGAVPGVDLGRIALAAYALHLRRRASVHAAPGGPSRWALAGRLRQTAPFVR